MTKIVINRCWGSFKLSEEAYAKLGIPWDDYGYAFVNDRANPELVKVVEERIPGFNRHLGLTDIRCGEGHAEIRTTVRADFTNRRGASHGGFIAALLDSVLGTAVVSGIAPQEWCGTIQLNVQFLAPGRGELLAKGGMVKRGRHVAFARGEVLDKAGRQIATAEGTWYVWPRHPDHPEGSET